MSPILLWRLPTRLIQQLYLHFAFAADLHEIAGDVAALSDAVLRNPPRTAIIHLDGLSQGQLEQCKELCDEARVSRQCRIFGTYLDVPPLPRESVHLGRAGLLDIFEVSTKVGFQDFLGRLYQERTFQLSSDIWMYVQPKLPLTATPVLRKGVNLAHKPFSVQDLSKAMHCSERTLRRLCVDTGLPTPNRLVALCRLLVAGYLWENSKSDIKWIADVLGYQSASSLSAMAKKHTGLTVRQLSSEDWTTVVGRAFSP